MTQGSRLAEGERYIRKTSRLYKPSAAMTMTTNVNNPKTFLDRSGLHGNRTCYTEIGSTARHMLDENSVINDRAAYCQRGRRGKKWYERESYPASLFRFAILTRWVVYMQRSRHGNTRLPQMHNCQQIRHQRKPFFFEMASRGGRLRRKSAL